MGEEFHASSMLSTSGLCGERLASESPRPRGVISESVDELSSCCWRGVLLEEAVDAIERVVIGLLVCSSITGRRAASRERVPNSDDTRPEPLGRVELSLEPTLLTNSDSPGLGWRRPERELRKMAGKPPRRFHVAFLGVLSSA